MKRFIIHKKDLHLISDRNYKNAVDMMGSDAIITNTDNLDYHNLDFVAICLTPAEELAFKNAGVEITESKPQPAIIGKWNGASVFQPTLGKYPFEEMGFDKYDNKNITGKNIKVGAIDSGFNPSGTCTINSGINYTSGDSSYADVVGHGTHVSYMCKSAVWGTIPNSNFRMIKCITDIGMMDETLFLAGVSDAIANQLQLVNMSFQLSGTRSVIQSAIDSLISAGCLPIVAGGNSGNAADVSMPASCFGTVAVGYCGPNFIIDPSSSLQVPSGGHGITIVAPGQNVPVGGDAGTGLGNGSSYAAPYVMAALACIMQEHNMNPFQALNLLKGNAIKSNSLYGAGFLNCP